MRLLALQGSPRIESNTQAVLDIVLEAARQAGAETEVVRLAGLDNLTGCMECHACQQKADEPGCAIDDDMRGIFAKALRSDGVVWAVPVFCWSPSWLTKMAMDRFYCMFKFQADGRIKCLLEGRRMAAVITAGGGENDGADSVKETCRRMAEFGKSKWAGAFVAANTSTPEAIKADDGLVERARRFGRELAS